MRTDSKQAADAVSTATGALSRPTPHALHGPITSADASIELMRLINGYQVSQALHVAAVLGVADQLKDGPKSGDFLARACGAHPASLYRLLRALAAIGVFHEAANMEFSLTRLGACLTGDATGSARNYARWIGTPGQWASWGKPAAQHQIGRMCAAIYLWGGCLDLSQAAPGRASGVQRRDGRQLPLGGPGGARSL